MRYPLEICGTAGGCPPSVWVNVDFEFGPSRPRGQSRGKSIRVADESDAPAVAHTKTPIIWEKKDVPDGVEWVTQVTRSGA